MRVDSHVHFWRLARGDYHWMTPDMTALRRDFGPDDLAPELKAAAIDAVILVQAAATVAETRFLLDRAAATPFVRGVVGWVDMTAPDVRTVLDDLCRDPWFKGVRPMIHDIPDAAWMLGGDLRPAFRHLVALDLSFDCLVRPQHLPNLLSLLEREPDLRAVICHGAKPAIAAGGFDKWAHDIARIARRTGAFCKLSGLITEAGPGWSVDGLRPYVDHLLACFGPGRLIWGSDWPVLSMTAGYADWVAASDRLLAGLDAAERAAVLGGNAVRVYRL